MVLVVALTLLHGTVRIGPAMPVCRAEIPCDRPAARITLTFVRSSQAIRVRTDAAGRYRVKLAPGTWTLRTKVGVRVTPVRFVIPRTSSALRNFTIDTGIR